MRKVLKRQAKVVVTRSSIRKAARSQSYCNFDGRNASIFRRFIIKLKGKGHRQSLPVQLPDAAHHQLDFTKAVISETPAEISLADEARKLDPAPLSFKMRNNNWRHYAHPLEMSYFDHGLLRHPAMPVDSVAPALPSALPAELALLKHVRNELSDVEDHHVSGNQAKVARNLTSFRKKWFLAPPIVVQNNQVDLPNWANLEGGTKFVNEMAFPELRKDATFIIKCLNSRNVQSTPAEITQSARKKWFLEPAIVKPQQVELPNWARENINSDTFASQLVSDQVRDGGLFIQQDPKSTFRARPVPPTTYKPDLPVAMIKGRQSFKNPAQQHQAKEMTKQISIDPKLKPFRARPVPPTTFKPLILPVVNKGRQSSIKDETKKPNPKGFIAKREVNLQKNSQQKPTRVTTLS
ncbi:hypothetical protein DAPPUDRAFT_312143 [Daphnia pulex]|uniref:Uncharacterized protein n=1 Tax=Daphnia pulex TaxID=6669 RepID=E9FYZ6_DAPPU|nr:hypothetical protein DAPPUDRAFT_312143 [Daphnia pulex]|eukprot:EFX87618.1 hypothetical protein DAPPUDRAFT_312143 [Daphnia pulex]